MKPNQCFFIIVLMWGMFCTSSLSFARGGSHTSSGGDLMINPTTDEDITSFLNSTYEWSQLIWLQKTLIGDLQYLIKTGLINSENNFFLTKMDGDKDLILRQLKAINSSKALSMLSALFSKRGIGNEIRVSEQTSCFSKGKKVSASIRFDGQSKSHIVCVDYAAIKKSSNKETFQLYLMSLLTHELVHVWNNDQLGPSASDYLSDTEVLPNYFQRLALAYFSYAHYIKARNSIHKIYSWVSETQSVLTIFKIAWDADLDAKQKHQMTGTSSHKALDIHGDKIAFLCKSYLRNSVFPSELIFSLNSIQNLFLLEGLVEVPISTFSHLTNVLQYLVILKYYCYINKDEKNGAPPSALAPFFDSLGGDNTTISTSLFMNIEKVLAEQYPQQTILQSSFPIASKVINIRDSVSFRSIIDQIMAELDYVYMSQKTIPALR